LFSLLHGAVSKIGFSADEVADQVNAPVIVLAVGTLETGMLALFLILIAFIKRKRYTIA
jgi:hypothetical protein